MRQFRLKPLGVALFCLFPAAAWADSVRLKLQPELLPIPRHTTDPLPLFVEADQIQGHQDKETEAQGNAKLRQRGKLVFADWLLHSKPDDDVTAVGNVRIEQFGDVVEGPRLKFNLSTERGTMDEPRFLLPSTGGRGTARHLEFLGEERYRVQNVNYTTCSPAHEDWWIRADQLEIDKGRDVGTARNATIHFMGVPVLYSPFLDFALHTQRKSGFLSPTLATSGKSGPELTVPYYWNIAPNRDATISPRVLAKRGLMVNNEVRYLDPTYRGETRLELLPNDRESGGANRHSLFMRHQQTIDSRWVAQLDIQKVSDDNYFRDLSTQAAVTSLTTLQRTGSLSRGGTWWDGGIWGASAVVQRWQTLQDPLAPILPPYNRQPQLTLVASKQNLPNVDLAMTSNYVDFNHPTLPNGRRLMAYPSVSMPVETAGVYVTPKLGLHLTRYDLDATTTALPNRTRTLPIFSAEGGMVFERDTKIRGESFLQTLEPKIYYLYVPAREQSLIPNFESAVQDINFASIFSENQFSGHDRINDANQITFGVTSRFLRPESGAEQLRVGVAQRFYLKGQEVTLPGIAPRTSNSSDFLSAISGTVARGWVAEAGWQYNTEAAQTQKLSAGVRYLPEPGKVLNMGYRFTRDSLEQIDISTQWPIRPGWTGLARWNYSLRESRLAEGIAGIEYNADCWAFRIVGHRVATATADSSTSIFMQLELNGVSKLGSNPFDVLRQNISGYSKGVSQPNNGASWYPSQ